MISLEALLFWIALSLMIGFAGGAVWRDGRALRVERELKGSLSALKLVNQSYRQEISGLRSNNGDAEAVKKILKTAEDYQDKLSVCPPGDRDWYWLRGVRHGLNASVVLIRGWL